MRCLISQQRSETILSAAVLRRCSLTYTMQMQSCCCDAVLCNLFRCKVARETIMTVTSVTDKTVKFLQQVLQTHSTTKPERIVWYDADSMVPEDQQGTESACELTLRKCIQMSSRVSSIMSLSQLGDLQRNSCPETTVRFFWVPAQLSSACVKARPASTAVLHKHPKDAINSDNCP